MRKCTALLFLSLQLSLAAYGQTQKAAAPTVFRRVLTVARPEEAGMSTERLARID